MKIWIDKQGGLHYHKTDCKIIHSKVPPIFKYEEVTHTVRRLGQSYHKEYRTIKVDGRYYRPCPFCFGHGNRRKQSTNPILYKVQFFIPGKA